MSVQKSTSKIDQAVSGLVTIAAQASSSRPTTCLRKYNFDSNKLRSVWSTAVASKKSLARKDPKCSHNPKSAFMSTLRVSRSVPPRVFLSDYACGEGRARLFSRFCPISRGACPSRACRCARARAPRLATETPLHAARSVSFCLPISLGLPPRVLALARPQSRAHLALLCTPRSTPHLHLFHRAQKDEDRRRRRHARRR